MFEIGVDHQKMFNLNIFANKSVTDPFHCNQKSLDGETKHLYFDFYHFY